VVFRGAYVLHTFLSWGPKQQEAAEEDTNQLLQGQERKKGARAEKPKTGRQRQTANQGKLMSWGHTAEEEQRKPANRTSKRKTDLPAWFPWAGMGRTADTQWTWSVTQFNLFCGCLPRR
jgi:hypothetical protein